MNTKASVKDVMDYFGMSTGEFKGQWLKLTQSDKDALKQGIGDGSLTY